MSTTLPLRRLAVLAGIAILAASGASAQSAGEWKNGEHVYQTICTYCHDTGIGPQIKGRQLPAVYVQHVVRNGFKAMPPFRASDIDDRTLADLADFINTSRIAAK